MIQRVQEIVAEHRDARGALLPVLHAVEAEFGCVDTEAVAEIAAGLNLSRAEVHGVLSFYRDFHEEPQGGAVLRICRSEACQAAGSEALLAHASSLGAEGGLTSPDGSGRLGSVYCLGNCALGPCVQVGDRVYGRVDPARLEMLMEQVR